MVRTRGITEAIANKKALKNALKIIGRSLTISTQSATLDNFGQLTAQTTTSYTARGDLQFGLDLDKRYIESGIIEVGEGVLYLHPDDTQPNIETNDKCYITIGDAVWDIINRVEAPTLDGTAVHYSYKCKRRINSNDFDD